MRKLFLSASLSLFALPLYAEGENCGPTQAVKQFFEQQFGERVVNTGATPDGVYVFSWIENPQTKTFTLLVTKGETTCVIGGGKLLEMG